MWDDAERGARELIRANSVAHTYDALPYIVLLQSALRKGALADTSGLEARALAELSADAANTSAVVTARTLAVQAELAALHRNVPRTAALQQDAVERRAWHWYEGSERPAFDAVRGDSLLAQLIHNPATDRHSPSP